MDASLKSTRRGKQNGPTSSECGAVKERDESNGWTEELSLDEEMKLIVGLQSVTTCTRKTTERNWWNEIKPTMFH